MTLNDSARQEIYDNGYTLLRGAVSRLLVDRALHAIHASIGENGIDPERLTTFRAQTYCPEIAGDSAISDLFNASPLHSLCEDALGGGNVKPVSRGQIALRFPGVNRKSSSLRPHLDGISTATNGVAPGTIGNFTSLVGVFLSEIPQPMMGNFCVWPGSHRAYETYFHEHGPDAFLEGTPQIELAEPVQVTAGAGDAVLCHYQLGHGIAPNLSPFIRYAIFFRVQHREHDSHRKEVLADIWRDWPGLKVAEISAS